MKNVLMLAGPTASGKTEYAIALANALDGEIVSADSMQLYQYLDIGSAKPTPEERAMAKHWLIDEIDPRQPFSAAEYKNKAHQYIEDIIARGKLPIVCGGTGLYFNALLYDMDFSGPAGNQKIRDRILEEEGNDPVKLHERLHRLDPKAAEDIHPNNIKRMVRAIERLENGEATLTPFSAVSVTDSNYHFIMIGLSWERESLYNRIDRRVDMLFDHGLADEVRNLMSKGFTSADIAMKGIGYKEIIDAVNLGFSPESASELIKLNTRHYAKRQMTWFRRYEDMKWFPVTENKKQVVLKEMVDYIKLNIVNQ